MQPTCFQAIRCMGFFWGVESSKVGIPAVFPNSRNVSPEGRSISTFWKIMLSLLSWSVLLVLLMGGNTEIIETVVPSIEVHVVNGVSVRNFNTHQNENYMVDVEALLHPVQSEGNDIISRSAIGAEAGRSSRLSGVVHVVPAPLNFSLEVFSGPFFPEQYTGLGVVGKGLAEAGLEGYHVGSRAFSFHGLLDVSVRCSGATTPLAPPMYPTFPQEATG